MTSYPESQIVQQYLAGASANSLAQNLGISLSTIMKILRLNNVTIRSSQKTKIARGENEDEPGVYLPSLEEIELLKRELRERAMNGSPRNSFPKGKRVKEPTKVLTGRGYDASRAS